MSRIVVLGIGSRVMKDDGIAVKVAEAIKERMVSEGIEIIIGETDFQFCVDAIKEDDFLIVLDAMYSGEKPGSINIFPLDDVLLNRSKLCSQHDMSLLDLITFKLPGIYGYMIGIEAAEVGFGIELSSLLSERFEPICQEVESTIWRIVKEIKDARYPLVRKNI